MRARMRTRASVRKGSGEAKDVGFSQHAQGSRAGHGEVFMRISAAGSRELRQALFQVAVQTQAHQARARVKGQGLPGLPGLPGRMGLRLAIGLLHGIRADTNNPMCCPTASSHTSTIGGAPLSAACTGVHGTPGSALAPQRPRARHKEAENTTAASTHGRTPPSIGCVAAPNCTDGGGASDKAKRHMAGNAAA